MGFDTEIIESIKFDDPSMELDDDDYDILLRQLEELFSTGKGEYPIPGVKIKWKKYAIPVPIMLGKVNVELAREFSVVVLGKDSYLPDGWKLADSNDHESKIYRKITNNYGLFINVAAPEHCVFDGINQILLMDPAGTNTASIPKELIHFPQNDPVYIARELESMSFGEHLVACIQDLNDLQVSYLSSAFEATHSVGRVIHKKMDINLTVFMSQKLEWNTEVAVFRSIQSIVGVPATRGPN